MTNDSRADLSRRIEDIESSYEFLLAYAAQGRQNEQGTDARPRLRAIVAALDGMPPLVRGALESGPADRESEIAPYLDAFERDAAVARGAVALVLRREAIPSLLVDNLNASVHLRALLTDLFLIEQFLRA